MRFSGLGRFFNEGKAGAPFLKQVLKIVQKNAEIHDCIPEYDLDGDILYKGVQAFVLYAANFLNLRGEIAWSDEPEVIFEKYKKGLSDI